MISSLPASGGLDCKRKLYRAEALATLANRKIRCVLLDMQLPERTAFNLAEAIRISPGCKSVHCASSPHACERRRTACVLGFSGDSSKPVRSMQVARYADRAIAASLKRGKRRRPKWRAHSLFSCLCASLADDNPVNQMVGLKYSKRWVYLAMPVRRRHGVSARWTGNLRYCPSRWQMPEMDGHQAATKSVGAGRKSVHV